MVSGIPMVGYRNESLGVTFIDLDGIRHSDGGVSELIGMPIAALMRWYQAFRWWGIGTPADSGDANSAMVSGIPMVGYRNRRETRVPASCDGIRHSDGGGSERGRAATRSP